MKKHLLIAFILGLSSFSYAKKVKFAVDMSGQTVNTTGVHVTGDFQTLAGFSGGDWMSNTTPLTQETNDPTIYSIIVDIPAFAKYEYKFLNGDQFYETEFVPEESRVGYNFSDNRWLYVDSLSNDTTFVGAIRFSENSPSGSYLLRFKVNMTNESSVNIAGVHVGTNFQSWNTSNVILYSFGNNVYECIAYIDTNINSCQFKFLNGTGSGDYETVPSACAVSGNRELAFTTHTVLDIVCFSECADCISSAGMDEMSPSAMMALYPNPANEHSVLRFNDAEQTHTVLLTNMLGKTVRTYSDYSGENLQIDKGQLSEGMYVVTVSNPYNTSVTTKKLLIQ